MGQNYQESTNSITSQICLAHLAPSEEPYYRNLPAFQKGTIVWEKTEPPRGFSDTPPMISARQQQLTRAQLEGSFNNPLVTLPEWPKMQHRDKLKARYLEMTRRRPRGRIILEEATFTESRKTLKRFPRNSEN